MSNVLSLTKQGGRVLGSGQMARAVGVLQYHVSALAKKGLIEFFLIDGNRYYDEAHVPAIRAACIEAGYIKAPTKPPAATHEDFTAFLASIDLDTGIQPLTANQREQLFEPFRNAKPVAAPTAMGAEVAYDPNYGTEAKS